MHEIKMLLNSVFNDCTAYWNSYHKVATAWGIVSALFYTVTLSCGFIHRHEISIHRLACGLIKLPFAALLGFYCCLVLEITVFSRSVGTVRVLRLVPFATWGSDLWHLTLWMENILMMVPLGILLYILWKPFQQIGWSMFAGALFSLLIECTQFIGRLGKFETDDIMNNVFGMLLGFIFCKGISKISCSTGQLLGKFCKYLNQ